jgi:hypothetical protein
LPIDLPLPLISSSASVIKSHPNKNYVMHFRQKEYMSYEILLITRQAKNVIVMPYWRAKTYRIFKGRADLGLNNYHCL